jgi:hypothetical protein
VATYRIGGYLQELNSPAFDADHTPGVATPYLDIYRCMGCGREDVSTYRHPYLPRTTINICWSKAPSVGASSSGRITIRNRRSMPQLDLAAIRTALEAVGVIFVEEDGEGLGVRLRTAS